MFKMGYVSGKMSWKKLWGKKPGYTGYPTAGQNENRLSKFGVMTTTINNPTAFPLKGWLVSLYGKSSGPLLKQKL